MCVTCGRELNPGARHQCGDCYEKTKRLPVCFCIDCGKQLNHRAHSVGSKRCSVCAHKATRGLPGTWVGRKHTKESIKKMQLKALARGSYPHPGMRGKRPTSETLRRMSIAHKGIHSGSKNPMWKGGISSERNLIQQSDAYRAWRLLVFTADDFTCCSCGQRGSHLHAHHILPFAEYPTLRIEPSNGATLCVPCHKNLHQELRRA